MHEKAASLETRFTGPSCKDSYSNDFLPVVFNHPINSSTTQRTVLFYSDFHLILQTDSK